MTPPVFHLPQLRSVGDHVLLDGPEGRHAAAVRRLRPGEELRLTDGAGQVAECMVEEVSRESLVVTVLRRRHEPAPQPRLVVVQALAKGGRDEDAVEAMTEVGVDGFVPWQASRSIARWKKDRWTAVAREAAKQSRRAWFPEVAPPASTEDVSRLLAQAARAVVLHESADEAFVGLDLPSAGDVVLVVGPEGGVSDEELAAFSAAGARVCRLGATVLRTSTAGVAAAAVLCARSGRWA